MLSLSAPDWCFFRGQLPAVEYYRALRDMGVTGVEMLDPARWQAARDAGLVLVNMSGPGMTVGLNRTAQHAELLPALRLAIDTAAKEQIPAVIVFSGNRDGLSTEEGITNCVTGLAQVAPYAEQAGVQLHFEMLCAHDHPDYQADSSAFGFQVVRGVNSPAVKALYDIYHMAYMGENVVDDICANLDIIAHIHVAETPRRSMPVASGQIDYAAIIPRVMDAGYQGYWGLEFIPGENVMEEVQQVVNLFQAYAGGARS